jgi:hypothetical protein
MNTEYKTQNQLYITEFYNIMPKIYIAFIVDDIELIKYCGIYRGFNKEYAELASCNL